MIDTHAHLDGEEFNDDREAVMQRAREAGITKILVPAIDLTTSRHILTLCRQHQGFLYPMVGLHPEEVHNWEPSGNCCPKSPYHQPALPHQPATIVRRQPHRNSRPSSPSARSASTTIGAVSSSTSN